MKRLLLCLLLILTLASCGEPPPKQGYVLDKQFTPAHWEDGYNTRTRQVYGCRPKSEYNYQTRQYETRQVCGFETESYQEYDPHYEWIDDAWALRLEECKVKDNKNKCNRGWQRVSESAYDRYRIGDHYPEPR